MNKKAVSPLIATLLLIFAAVVLGVLVMNWGRAQVEAGAKCSVVTDMKFIEIGGVDQICYSAAEKGFIEFTVENGVNVDIEKLHFRVIGSKKVYATELTGVIEKAGALKQTVPYNGRLFGEVKQVKITPKIILYPGDPAILCEEQAIVAEKVRKC